MSNDIDFEDMAAIGAMVGFTALAVALGATSEEADLMLDLAAQLNENGPLSPSEAVTQLNGYLSVVRFGEKLES